MYASYYISRETPTLDHDSMQGQVRLEGYDDNCLLLGHLEISHQVEYTVPQFP
jgi:hypothetical protein